MHRILRQMILGFGTFGTGTALLYLDVNPYLLVLTDTVVGIGMLFAAGSLTVDDLRFGGKGVPGGEPAAVAGGLPADTADESHGFRASLGKLGGSLKPAIGRLGKGKEEQETHTKEIDRMLDMTLAGQSRRLISIAEGQETTSAGPAAAGPVATAIGSTQPGEDLLQEVSAAGIMTPFLDDEGTGPDGDTPQQGGVKPGAPTMEEVSPAALAEPEEVKEEVPVDAIPLGDGELGADDLLSALRLETMKEKKRDDASLLRDLQGVKVTGRELLDELDSLVREIRGR